MTLSLFLHLVSLEARKQMSYRVDFWTKTILGFAAELGVYVFLAGALFKASNSPHIRGYDQEGLVLYFVVVMLLGRIVRGAPFGETISDDIYHGGLTRYLLFPRSYLSMKYAQNVGALVPVFFQSGLLGVGAYFYLENSHALPVTPRSVGMALVSAMVGNLLFFLARAPLQMVSFWQDNVWSLIITLGNTARLFGGAMIPLALFPAWSQGLLRWLPFRHFYDVPARTLLGRLSFGEWAFATAQGGVWCLVMATLCQVVWSRGDRQYTGIGI